MTSYKSHHKMFENFTCLIVDKHISATTYFPDCICEITSLTHLIVNSFSCLIVNQNYAIPHKITKLHNLKVFKFKINPWNTNGLMMSRRNLRTFQTPDLLYAMRQITFLNLSGMSFQNHDFEHLCKLYGLTHLILKDCDIKSIPLSITHLRNLEHVNLEDNMLSSHNINDTITSLPKLTYLNLNLCGLIVIPDKIYNLTNLTELQLANNGILEITPEIALLKNLRLLNISGNSTLRIYNDASDAICNVPEFKQLIIIDDIDWTSSLKNMPFTTHIKKICRYELFYKIYAPANGIRGLNSSSVVPYYHYCQFHK